jgi:DMSO/TMAO reductase YedYZ molybdopterin-dependent catalytic subunit
MRRARFIVLTGATALAGCSGIADKLGQTDIVRNALSLPEHLNFAILGAGQPLAREYRERDVSPVFRANGFMPPSSPQYAQWATDGWRGYRLSVSGLVAKPASYSLAELRGRFNRVAQITRHDCVEGWSVIGKWGGPRLGDFLQRVGADLTAKYVGFQCADGYYGSIDMPSALHPQTIMAVKFADEIIPAKYGYPFKVRIPTKLGFKNPKWVTTILVTNRFPGGFWEDRGYNWFSGS